MKKVIVGISGGVDSAVAALLLKEKGYEVEGLFMRNWDSMMNNDTLGNPNFSENICPQEIDYNDALKTCEILGIKLHRVDFIKEYWDYVFTYFLDELKKGRTPNPDMLCNKFIKFDLFKKEALKLGADYIATGHYARIIKLANGRYTASQPAACRKDQTYVLYSLEQKHLRHTLMPAGDYTKEEIRAIAKKAGLNVADKSESQDICFVPDGDYASFIERETGRKCTAGNFIDEDGNILGVHKGIENYTIGQRKGLNLPAKQPYYIKRIIPSTREIVLGDAESVFTDTVFADNINYMAVDSLKEPIKLTAKIRYAHAGAECEVIPLPDGRLECHFKEKQRAVTPGQAIVFYENGYIFGGGRIIQPC